MAHSTMHFAVGLAVGTAVMMPAVLRKLKAGENVGVTTGRLLFTSYALAVFAIIPNILRHSGIPDSFCSGWWMNLFLLNPLIDRLKSGGMLVGEISVMLLFIIQYAIILAGIIRTTGRSADKARNIFPAGSG